jgi:very-short-patch-repair endonuclease
MDYRTASPDRYTLLKAFAQENRKNPTLAEQQLWKHLERKQLGIKFLRQHIIGDYIVDFVCIEKGLIVEVDGGYHNTAEQRKADANRSEELARIGFEVIRFSNEEVFLNINNVLKRIKDRLLENDS